MSQIEELQGRIAAALDRISQGMDLQANSNLGDADDGAEVEALRKELEEERVASEQLKERNKVLSERVQELTERLEQDDQGELVQTLRGRLEKNKANIERLHELNDNLRDSNANLREANKSRVGEPHLINSSMIAELENHKAMREMEKEALESLLSSLETTLDAPGAGTEESA